VIYRTADAFPEELHTPAGKSFAGEPDAAAGLEHRVVSIDVLGSGVSVMFVDRMDASELVDLAMLSKCCLGQCFAGPRRSSASGRAHAHDEVAGTGRIPSCLRSPRGRRYLGYRGGLDVRDA
jgi:hypothetical protein